MEPKELIIPIELLQKLGAYLVKQPYEEVAQLINELQQLKPAPLPAAQTPTYDDIMRAAHREATGTIDDPLPTPPYSPAKVQNL